MRSSPSEAAAMAVALAPLAPLADDPPGDAPADLDIRQRTRVQPLLPQTMFGRTLPPDQPAGGSLIEEQLRFAMKERVGRPYRMDAVSDPRDIHVRVQLPNGVFAAEVPRNRVYTSTTYIFVLWMVGSSLVLMS